MASEKKQYDIRLLKSKGENIFISHLVSIARPHLVTVGSHVAIDDFFACTTALETGDYVHISKHVAIIGGEKGLFRMGHFSNLSVRGTIVCISDAFNGEGLVTAPGLPEAYRDSLLMEPVIFEDFVNTGANVTIMPGVTVPEGAVIGACSLVRKNDSLKPWTIYAGNPLREIKSRPKEKMLAYAAALGYKSSR